MRDCSRVIGSRVFLGPKNRSPVKKGDVILTSLPFAHVLSYDYLSMYCDTCASPLRERLLHPCGECRVVWYCSEECRHAAMSWHRLECFALKRRKCNPPGSFVRLLARVIFRLRDGGDKYEERCGDKVVRRFRDLMNHYVDLKNNEDMKPEIDKNLADLRNYIGERLLPNESDLLGIYGRTLVNCFSFADTTMLNIGCAVYLAASIFDHDCSPNCFVTFSGLKVEIRSLIDMPHLDFAKCHISYVDPVSTVAARQQDLYKGWFFLCKCQTCEDKEKATYENSIKCKMPGCHGLVSIPEASDIADLIKMKIEAAREKEERKKKERQEKHRWRRQEEKKREREQEKEEQIGRKEEKEKERQEEKTEKTEPRCSVCGWTACSETIQQYWAAVAFTKERMRAMDNDNLNIENCLQILERQKAFSFMNAWRVRTLDCTFNAAILNSCWSLAMKYGEENRDGMRFYYGVKNTIFYIFLFKLGKTNIYLKEFREGLRILEEAEPWLITGLGDSHPIVEELCQLTLLANEDREICLERWHEASKKREQKFKVNKQDQLQQLPFLSSQNESLAGIFDTLNQMYCSPSKELNGV